MKKIFLLAVLITAYTFATGQPETLVDPKTTTIVKLDSNQAAGVDTLQVAQYLTVLNAWLNGCGADGLLLFKQGKEIGLNVKDIFKDLPLPTSTDGLTAWVDKIKTIFDSLGGIFGAGSPIVVLFTWLLSKIFKKDPKGTINKIQLVFNRIRTRYLVLGSALVVTIVSAFLFNDGSYGIQDAFASLLVFGSVTVGSLGIQGFLNMFGIHWFDAKKVPTATA